MIRIHPAIVAQAAATVAAMMPGRFLLGVGTGENLNEHVLGARWPLAGRAPRDARGGGRGDPLLWQGGEQTHRGKHYTVNHARIYTLPDDAPPRSTSRRRSRTPPSSPAASATAFISTAPESEVVKAFEGAGGKGKPKIGMMHCAYDEDEERGTEARARSSGRTLRAAGAARPGARDAGGLRGGRRDGRPRGRRGADAARARPRAVPRA